MNWLRKIFGKKKIQFGTGAIPDPEDVRDRLYDVMGAAAADVDWEKGYDVEKELGIKIPFKNQGQSGSCVGQGWAYYLAILNMVETGKLDEVSAKSIYSLIQIGLAAGGAYIRDGAKLAVNWGALMEAILFSYETFTTQDINGPRIIKNPPSEQFMKDKSWKTPEMDKLAEILQAKEYRTIVANRNMDLFAQAIRDNHGVVSGVNGSNNGTWNSQEPKPPTKTEWGHCIYFGKFGTDEKGKYISTPNSWGERNPDGLHKDGWQKIRADYFDSGNMFNPWILIDKPNTNNDMSKTNVKVIKDANSAAVGFWLPSNSPDGLTSMARNYDIDMPKKADGKLDWDKIIEGELTLK